MSNKRFRKPITTDSTKEWTRKTGADRCSDGKVGMLSEQSPYYGDEVEHPYCDDEGCPVEYLDRKTKERLIDLVAPGVEPAIGERIAKIVLATFGGRVGYTKTAVPCYKNGDVQDCAATNLFWGEPDNPLSAESLSKR